MYSVPVHVWVPFATINFGGNAELWLQNYEAHHFIACYCSPSDTCDSSRWREVNMKALWKTYNGGRKVTVLQPQPRYCNWAIMI
jgi:hypothetical protein